MTQMPPQVRLWSAPALPHWPLFVASHWIAYCVSCTLSIISAVNQFIADDSSETPSDVPCIKESKQRDNKESTEGGDSSKGNVFRELENMSGNMFLDLPQGI